MNSSISASTGHTPHKLMYGTELRQAWDMLPQAFDHDQDFQARIDAEQSLAYAAMKMKTYFDRKHKPIHFQPGECVYLKLTTNTTDKPGYTIPANADRPRKFKQRFVGRFQVIHRVGRLAYKLKFPDSRQRHPVVSVEHLEKCPQGDDPWDRQADDHHDPTDDERFPDEERYEVDRILAKRTTKPHGRPHADGTSRALTTKYLIRWKGQSAEEDQWVAAEDIAADEAIAEFEARQQAHVLSDPTPGPSNT
jgi:hypothetical protein